MLNSKDIVLMNSNNKKYELLKNIGNLKYVYLDKKKL